ncbi:MAG: patatin-like phospholipase family protein [Planctomycetota bacterium]
MRALVLFVLLAACSSTQPRQAVPAELHLDATIPGIPLARDWADTEPDYWNPFVELSGEKLRAQFPALAGNDHNYLAVSGGGQNGAYGAGLLCGWTETGKRPEFEIVAGVSAGALIAPFAFLGSAYDDRLKSVFTTLSTKDLVKEKGLLSILQSDAAATVEGLKRKIREYYPDALIDAVAEEYRKGRVLLVGTTHLDAKRPMIWSMGIIASSDSPGRYDLFRRVLLASAAIPGAFPPVLFQVEANDAAYDELHVDGAATLQVFLYPESLDWGRVLRNLQVEGEPTAYVIQNGRLRPDFQAVDRKFFTIAGRTIEALVRANTIGNIYRIYLNCKRDGIAFRRTAIPDDFDEQAEETFDPKYMQALFQVGFEAGRRGDAWSSLPPYFTDGR